MGSARFGLEAVLFLLTLPFWFVFAKMLGLYARDDARATTRRRTRGLGVINLVTVGTWVVFVAAWATKLSHPQLEPADRLLGAGADPRAHGPGARPRDRQPDARLRAAKRISRRGPRRPARRAEDPAAPRVRDQPGRLRRREPARTARRGLEDCRSSAGPRSARVIVSSRRSTASSSPSRAAGRRDDEPVRSLRDQEVSSTSSRGSTSSSGPRADIHLIEGLAARHRAARPASAVVAIVKRVIDLVGAAILLARHRPVFVVAGVQDPA